MIFYKILKIERTTMQKISTLFTVTIILLASGTHASDIKNNTAPIENEQTDKKDKNISSEPFMNVKILSEEETDASKLEKKEREKRELDNLSIQNRLANATDKIVLISLIQAIIGVLGTISLIYTIILNQRSTNTAIETLHSDRAWIIPDLIDAGTVKNSFIDGQYTENGLVFIMKWKNAGRSPSLETDCYVQYKIIERSEEIPLFSRPNKSRDSRRAVAGPNTVFSGVPIGINDEFSEKIRSRKYKLIIYSQVEYRDIFSNSNIRHSEMCLEVDINGQQEQNGQLIPRFTYTAVGTQNNIS